MTSATKALRVITADNPSPLTGAGTNTFLLGRGRIAVIDPGPDLPAHDAEMLTGGGNQALIVLGDQVYNLRITRAGKLILTK